MVCNGAGTADSVRKISIAPLRTLNRLAIAIFHILHLSLVAWMHPCGRRLVSARLLAVFMLLLCVVAGHAFTGAEDDQFRRGLSAFNVGDYAAALTNWRPLAERGEPRSQAGIGFMYHHGLGVTVDDREAAVWLRRAAEQGQAEGELMLGILFYYGSGVMQSYVQAYAWCELAGINGNGDASLCRDASLEAMSNAEREEAFRLVVELRARQRRSDR
jgi:hypothetical protein